jgi:hypothetical protein
MSYEKVPGEIAWAIGTNGRIAVTNNKIVIQRSKGFGSMLLHGLKGDKEIFISKISSIQFKLPGTFSAGYIQFELGGGLSSQRGILAATQDENTVMFAQKTDKKSRTHGADRFTRLKNFIEEKMEAKENPQLVPVVQQVEQPAAKSPVEQIKEWKELLDAGAITEEEYNIKKKEILGSQ